MSQERQQNATQTDVIAFAVKEAYRTIRTNLMFSLAKKGCKNILFTSAIQGEGKTTTCANVAYSISTNNKKVLLMDVDLRKPRLHRQVKLPCAPGLTNYLSGFNSLEEVLHKDVFPGLDVICAGTITPTPSEMVASEGFANLLEKLQESYDFIIIDTPPVNLVSDALALMPLVDGSVLVIRSNYTARKAVQKAIEQIRFVEGKILGTVANGVETERKRGYYRYSRYGRYGGYGSDAYGSYTSHPSQDNAKKALEEKKDTAETVAKEEETKAE